jgi:cellobiose phosphorylase
MYGGRQEWLEQGIIEWKSCVRQTWSATAFIRMVLMGLIGLEFNPRGITFRPLMPEGYETLKLSGLCYRDMILNIYISGTGSTIKEFSINGKHSEASIDSDIKGDVEINIVMDNSGEH